MCGETRVLAAERRGGLACASGGMAGLVVRVMLRCVMQVQVPCR